MKKCIEGTHLEVSLHYSLVAMDLPDTAEISMPHNLGARSVRIQNDLRRMGYSIQIWDSQVEEWDEINFVALTEEQQRRLDDERGE